MAPDGQHRDDGGDRRAHGALPGRSRRRSSSRNRARRTPPHQRLALDDAGTKVAYVATTSRRSRRSCSSPNADGTGERQLTSFNDKLNAEVAFSDAERFTYKSVGGLEIEGWLMKPYGYEAGKKYPLVLYIHGGPHSRVRRGLVRRVPESHRRRDVRAVHEPARLERLRRRLHVLDARPLVRRGLRRI